MDVLFNLIAVVALRLATALGGENLDAQTENTTPAVAQVYTVPAPPVTPPDEE